VEGAAPRLYGAQASGCAPIVNLVERGDGRLEPVIPNTIARSLAIGNPADGPRAARAIRSSGGWAAGVSEQAIISGVRLLAETTGIYTESAGGVTVAAAESLARAGRLTDTDEVVLCITAHGLKTPDLVPVSEFNSPIVNPKLRELIPLVESN
jgi:threonine synthase